MKTLIAQSPNPAPDIPTPRGASEWAIVAAAAAFLIREGVTWFKNKDESESKQTQALISGISGLTQTLINDLRNNQTLLIENNKEGFKEVSAATRETGTQISKEVNAALKSQALHYAEFNETLNKVLFGVQALHSRMDDFLGSRKDNHGGPSS